MATDKINIKRNKFHNGHLVTHTFKFALCVPYGRTLKTHGIVYYKPILSANILVNLFKFPISRKFSMENYLFLNSIAFSQRSCNLFFPLNPHKKPPRVVQERSCLLDQFIFLASDF